jgi:predicted acetyltransferase
MTAASFLVRPAAVFRESYLEALREGFNQGGSNPIAPEKIAGIEADFGTHLAALDNDGQSQHQEFGRMLASVASNTFWLVEAGKFIGGVNIRSRADTHVLARYGGHIGYGIRPSMREQGYGTHILRLALQICRGMGTGIVRIGCAEDNIASRRVIEGNGGVLLRRCEPDWYAPGPYLLFEILLV